MLIVESLYQLYFVPDIDWKMEREGKGLLIQMSLPDCVQYSYTLGMPKYRII
jgi:hypothetical protein